MRSPSLRVATIVGLAVVCACERGPTESLTPAEVRAVFKATLPTSATDPAWATAPVHPADLLLQDMVDPRLMTPSTPTMRVQAIADGKKIAFRLRWPDTTKNDLPGAASFADACAVQLPAVTSPDVPAPQMGESGKPVLIIYWSAFWQATVDGRPDEISAVYPNAKVDHYPFQAAPLAAGSPEQKAMALRYAPARAVGNVMAGPRDRPVQDLIAEGPGTLHPASTTVSDGGGVHDGVGWTVTLTRPLPDGVGAGGRTQVAVAVWQGAKDEVGAKKMRSAWIPLTLEARP